MKTLLAILLSLSVNCFGAGYSEQEKEVIRKCSQKSEIWMAEKCMQQGGIDATRLNGPIGFQICLMRDTNEKVALCYARYNLDPETGRSK